MSVDIPCERAASAVAYLDSMRHRIEELMRTGDIVPEEPGRGKATQTQAEIDAETLEMKELYDTGLSLLAVGKRFGVSASAVKWRFHARGMSVRAKKRGRPGKLTPEDRKQIIEMKRNGAKVKEIAAKYKVSRRYIGVICKGK